MHRKERGGRGNRCTGRSGEGGATGAQEEVGQWGNRCTGRSGAIGAQEGAGRAGQQVHRKEREAGQ